MHYIANLFYHLILYYMKKVAKSLKTTVFTLYRKTSSGELVLVDNKKPTFIPKRKETLNN